MAEYSAIVQFGRDIQQTLIPIENRKPSLASACSHFIEDMTHIEEEAPFMDRMMKEIGARIGVIAMPFFVSLSVIQLGGAFACHLTLMIVNWDWDVDLLTDYAVQIAKMVVDVFAQIIIFPIAIVAPTVYRYEPYTPPRDPKDVKIEGLQSQLAQKERDLIKRDQALLPQITLTNFEDLEDTINGMVGIFAKKYDHGEDKDDPELCFSTWESGGHDKIVIRDPEKFLCPNDTLELQLDFSNPEAKRDSLIRFLHKDHKIDRLVLKGAGDIDFLLDLPDEQTTLHNIHTLVVQNFELTKSTLTQIAQKFPNIACYYLSESVIDQEAPEFQEHYIYFEPKVKGGRSVVWGNLQERYDDFNAKLKGFMESYSPRGFASDFLNVTPTKLLHPIAPFIRRVAFLRKTEIRDGHLDGIHKGLKKYFPNMRILDLSECNNLTVGAFTTLAMLHPQEVHLVGCDKHLLYERLSFDKIIQILGEQGITAQRIERYPDRLQITIPSIVDVAQIKIRVEQVFPAVGGCELEYGSNKHQVELKKVFRPAPEAFATAAIKYYINGGDHLKMNGVEGVYPLNKGIEAVIPALAIRDEMSLRVPTITFLNTDDHQNYAWKGTK